MTEAGRQKFPVCQEEVAQGGAAAADAGLDGAQRGAGGLGDLLVGEPLHVAEDDGQALVRRQRRQASFEAARQLLPLGPLLQWLVGRGRLRGGALLAGRGLQRKLPAGATAAKLVVAGVGGYPEQPGAKAAPPEPGDGAEGGDERLLGGVLRRLR